MMEASGGFDLPIDWWLEGLSWRCNPVDDGGLQPLRIISTSAVDAFLYLRRTLGAMAKERADAYKLRDVLGVLLGCLSKPVL